MQRVYYIAKNYIVKLTEKNGFLKKAVKLFILKKNYVFKCKNSISLLKKQIYSTHLTIFYCFHQKQIYSVNFTGYFYYVDLIYPIYVYLTATVLLLL